MVLVEVSGIWIQTKNQRNVIQRRRALKKTLMMIFKIGSLKKLSKWLMTSETNVPVLYPRILWISCCKTWIRYGETEKRSRSSASRTRLTVRSNSLEDRFHLRSLTISTWRRWTSSVWGKISNSKQLLSEKTWLQSKNLPTDHLMVSYLLIIQSSTLIRFSKSEEDSKMRMSCCSRRYPS